MFQDVESFVNSIVLSTNRGNSTSSYSIYNAFVYFASLLHLRLYVAYKTGSLVCFLNLWKTHYISPFSMTLVISCRVFFHFYNVINLFFKIQMAIAEMFNFKFSYKIYGFVSGTFCLVTMAL